MAWLVSYGNTIPVDDTVKKGDLLLQLASPDYRDHVEAMRIIDHYDFFVHHRLQNYPRFDFNIAQETRIW